MCVGIFFFVSLSTVLLGRFFAPTFRFGPNRVGYMKPVGQKHVLVEGESGEGLKASRGACSEDRFA